MDKAAKFRRITFNGVAVQATSRRSSDRDNKAWARTVRKDGSERVVHYADPNLPMRRNNPEARRNFMARHNCSDKKDPFAPGFWACYDWANPSEKEAFMSEEQEEKMMHGEMAETDNPVPLGAVSFAEAMAAEEAGKAADEVHELTYKFQKMVGNIMLRDDVEDKAGAITALAGEYTELAQAAMDTTKERWQPLTDAVTNKVADLTKAAMKTEGGIKFPARDFAYTPDKEKPSGWKLRLAEGRPGNVTVQQLGRAAAALSPGGFRGQQVQIPNDAMAGVKRKIRAAYRKLNVKEEDIPDSVKETGGFSVWKETDGRYHWLAVYSNNFRDDDNPKEIISASAHQEFVKAVDAGEWDRPELWFWHVKGTRFGKASIVGYDDSGFPFAYGLVDREMEHVAESLANRDDLLVSHGMPTKELRRDSDDPTIITRYRSREISVLPAWAAANKHTGFVTIQKEVTDMAIPEKKKQELESVGFDVESLEAQLQAKKTQAEQEGRESKEIDAKDESAQAEQVAEQAESAAVEATEAAEPPAPALTAEDVTQAIGEGLGPVFDQIGQRLEALEGQIKELSERDDAETKFVKEAATMTPAASLAAGLRNAFMSDETRVDGRKSRHDAPKETDPQGSEKGIVAGHTIGGHTVNQLFGTEWWKELQDQ